MLSGSRKKTKWALDPQNLNWANNDDKFGSKMLMKMGWSKGKGLGANEDGAVDNIKVKVKNDSLGLGCSLKHDANWVAHQDDFSSLLENLNNNHQKSPSHNTSTETDIKSLEVKSKTQKRVHYHKFTKGKDLSNYKSEDMAAIFGKKQQNKAFQENESELKEKSNKEAKSDDSELCHIKSKLSVQEYFDQRMKSIKEMNNTNNTKRKFENKLEPEVIEQEQPVKKKKKKKDKKKNKK